MRRRLSVVARCLPGIVILWAGVAAGGAGGSPVDARQPYRFVLTGEGKKRVAFRGLISVDGTDRLIERETTPFEFRCEAGSVIAGYFEVLDVGRTVRLKVFDPTYSDRKPYAWAKRQARVRFSWAQPGVGPRCLALGDAGDACSDATPSAEELERRLKALLEADEREAAP